MFSARLPLLAGLLAAALSAHARQKREFSSADSLRFAPHMNLETISGKEFMRRGYLDNPLENLAGRLAGVSVTTDGAERMAMLAGVRVRGTTSITGGNDPLVIIDGVSSDLEALSTVWPGDIERFEVLKDAAQTAQYGSRGAAGVIVVTTRKGKTGRVSVSYDGSFGLQAVSKRLEMLSAAGYVATAQNLGLDYTDGGASSDYLRFVERMGWLHSHHVALSGGNESSGYRASVAYRNREMVVKNCDTRNFVAKVDLNQKAFADRLHIDFGLFASTTRTSDVFDVQKLFYGAATQNPTYPLSEKPGGGWFVNPTASQIAVPQAVLRADNDLARQHLNTHVQLRYALTSELKISGLASYSNASDETAQFYPTWIWAQGQAVRRLQRRENILANLAADYEIYRGAHHFEAHILGEWQRSALQSFGTLVKGFATNETSYHNLSAGALRPYGGTQSDRQNPALASLLLSVRHRIFNKYGIALSARADGSSLVGSRHTWGWFPAIAGEWNVKGERIFRHADWLNRFKLRVGYGEAGNLAGISAYNAERRLTPVNVVPINGAPVATLNEARNYNPDLRWERRATVNAGIEAAVWDNRIVITAEAYHSATRDMLYEYDVPVPPFVYDKLLANNGRMTNDGFELGCGVTPLRTRDWEFTLNANVTFQRNRLASLSGDVAGMHLTAPDIVPLGGLGLGAGFHGGNNYAVYQIVGQPLGVFYLPHSSGLKTGTDGARHYDIADLDGNGRVNIEDGGDRRVAGQATPKVMFGSNLALRYRNFDLAVQINGAFGHKILNATALAYMNMTSFPDYNVMRDAPRENIRDQNLTDYWLEPGDFVNIDYVTVGWNVPLRSRRVSALRLSCSVNNLCTVTAYSGLTPMINSNAVGPTLGIDDKRSFPVYRTYSFGVSLQF